MCAVLALGAAVVGCSSDEPSASTVAGVAPEGSGDPASTEPGSTVPASSPGSTVVPPTSPAATAVEQPPVGVDTLPPVSLAVPAEVESGLEFTVVAVRDIEADPEPGSGDIVGPAAAVDVEVVNNGDDDVDLSRIVVTAAAADAELSPIAGTFDEPFAGVLAPGETASAMYGFRTGGAPVTTVRLDDGRSHSVVIVEL